MWKSSTKTALFSDGGRLSRLALAKVANQPDTGLGALPVLANLFYKP